jgi:hypothetical protein
MKQTSTIQRAVLCLAFSFIAFTSKAQNNTNPISFSTVPTLIEGVLNLMGAKYRFYKVRNNVDAIIKIVSSTGGATVDIFDDNTVTKPEAFSPKIKVLGNTTGTVTFKIEFVKHGSLIPVYVPQDSLFATAIDIDGFATLKEVDAIDMGANALAFYASATPEISLVKTGTVYKGTNTGGIEYDGVDSAEKKVMFTVKNRMVSSFTYTAGAINNNSYEVSRQKSIYFKNFVYPNQATLPVKYSSFEANAADQKVMLKWITSMETNNDHFEVERSFSGSEFSTIGLVLDAETVNGSARTYRFKDNSPLLAGKSVVYYRLKQVDRDGNYTYSSILAVRFAPAASDFVMQAAPNPFVNQLTLRFSATGNGNAQIRVIGTNGQTLLSKQTSINKGFNNIVVDDLGKLPKAAYTVQLLINGNVAGAQQLIKN